MAVTRAQFVRGAEDAGIRRIEKKVARPRLEPLAQAIPHPPVELPKTFSGTAAARDIDKLVKGEHAAPHDVLGPHSVQFNQQPATAVRAFFPECREVNLVMTAPFGAPERFTRIPMKMVHPDGVFETILPK